MFWHLRYAPEAIRNLDSMDGQVSQRLVAYLNERVLLLEDPRMLGKALRGSKWGGCWRYRCGDYRIIVRLIDQEMVVMVLRAGNRKNVY
jgi:mRNA interferase RelE/StbE